MICPSCKSDVVMPPLAPAAQGRRWKRVEMCTCGVEVQVSTCEGWERWYALAWRPPGTPGHGGWREDQMPDRDEHYARLERDLRKQGPKLVN